MKLPIYYEVSRVEAEYLLENKSRICYKLRESGYLQACLTKKDLEGWDGKILSSIAVEEKELPFLYERRECFFLNGKWKCNDFPDKEFKNKTELKQYIKSLEK